MRFQFTTYDRVCIGSIALRFNKYTDRLYEFRREDAPDLSEVYSESDLFDLLKRKDYRFEREFYSSKAKKSRTSGLAKQLSGLSSDSKSCVLFRYAISRAFDELWQAKKLKKTDKDIQRNFTLIRSRALEVCAEIGLKLEASEYLVQMSPRTLRNYHSAYLMGSKTLLLLGDKRRIGRETKKHFDNQTTEFINECAWGYAHPECPNKGTVADNAILKLKKENQRRLKTGETLLQHFSKRTLIRRIDRLDPFEVDCVRLGRDEARKKYATASIGLPISTPLERVEIDAWTIDVESLFVDLGILESLPQDIKDDMPTGRRYLLTAIDAATRCILALKISASPTSEDARTLFKQIFTDKSEMANQIGSKSDWKMFGTPSTIAFDTAGAFVSDQVVEPLAGLGIQVEYAPVKVPELRARQERVFRTMTQNLIPRLPGRTFGSIEERRQTEHSDRACLTDDELAKIMMLWVVDYYHHRLHGGLGGQTPYNAWKEKTGSFGVAPPPGAEQISTHLGVEFECTLQKTGLRLFALDYNSSELRARFKRNKQRKYIVRVDPDDIRFVMVWINDQWLRADCQHPNLAFTTLYEWSHYCKELKQKFNREAEISAKFRDNAQGQIGEIVARALKRKGISPTSYSAEKIQRLETQLFQGVVFSEPVEVCRSTDPDITFGEVIEQPLDTQPPLDEVKEDKEENDNSETFNPDISNWKLEDE